MAFSPILGIRIAQLVLSIIVLGIGAYSVNIFNDTNRDSSPSSLNFVIFCCVWTWLALAYTFLTPRFLPRFHDKWAILGVEAATVIFWFSGFVALAVFVGDRLICIGSACGAMKATVAFACFAWLSWVASLVLVCLSIFRGRNDLAGMPLEAGQHHPVGQDTAYVGGGGVGYGNDGTSSSQMGFNPSDTPAPYSASSTPAPYDPHHGGNGALQPDYTGVSSVSAVSQQQNYGAPVAGAYGGGQSGPYDPHYSQHDNYNVAEMPAAAGYGGLDRGQQQR